MITQRQRGSVGSRGEDARLGFAALLCIALLAGLALQRLRGPEPVPADAPPQEFSSGRAAKHVAEVARESHPIGSAAHARARDYILGELSRLGVPAEVQRTTALGPGRGERVSAATVENIVGVHKGTAGGKAVMLVAHYDSVATGPGAGDDAAGVASVLEVLRALKAGPPLRNDVVALFTDGEEAGLLGAWGFVGEHQLAREVGLVLNFEARGAGGPSLMFETSGGNGWLIEEFGKAASRPVASSLSYELYKLLPNDTDLSAFKKSGMAGLNFAFFDDAERYHTALDTAAGLDERSLQHHGLYGLELTRHFGNLATDYPKASDAIYFDILGFTVVSYSASWAVPLAILATVLLAFAVWLGLRRKAFTLSGVGVGALLVPVAAATVWLAVSGVWRVVALLRPDYALFGRGEIYNSDYYASGFSALAAAVTTGLYVLLRGRFGALGLAVGAAVCWWVLAALSSLYFPGGSYLFLFPLVFALVALIAGAYAGGGEGVTAGRFALLAVCAVPALVLCVPMASLAFSGLTVRMGAPVAGFVALLAGLLLPLIELVVRRRGWLLPAGLALAGLGLIAAGVAAGGFSRERPRPTNLFYALNGDTGGAVWASVNREPDEWTSQFFKPAQRGELREFFPSSSRAHLRAAAPAFPLTPPACELLEEGTDGGLRTLRLRVRSQRQAPTLSFYLENAAVERGAVNGKALEPRAQADGDARWELRYYGVPAEGLDLSLTVRPNGPLKVRVVDQSYGLAEVSGAGFGARPAGLMPMSQPTSDVVLVSKSYVF